MNTTSQETPQYLRRIFWVFLVCGIILRLALVVVIPMYPDYMQNPTEYMSPGYNDEPLHLQYVRYVSEYWEWPVWQASRDSANFRTGEYLQPPAHYFLAVPFFLAGHSIREAWELHSTRLLSVIFGIFAALFVYWMVQIWTKNEKIALGAYAAMLFSPNTLIFTSLVTNDGAILCLAAIVYYKLVQYQSGTDRSYKPHLIIGGLLGLGVWIKLSGLNLLPLVWFVGHHLDSYKKRWISRIGVSLFAILVASPVPIWNWVHYDSISPNTWIQIVPETWPEPLTRGEGTALSQPFQSLKTCVRLGAMPFEKLWGSPLEKTASLLWATFWGGLLAVGGVMLVRQKSLGWMFWYGFVWSLAGFIIYNLEVFQVEFRLFAPIFPGFALMAAIAADRFRIPLIVQAIIWCLPVLFIPLYVGYAP